MQYTDYLEVHLKSVSTINAIKTQGRIGADQYHIKYRISFLEESSTNWLVYKDDDGNNKVSTLTVFYANVHINGRQLLLSKILEKFFRILDNIAISNTFLMVLITCSSTDDEVRVRGVKPP